MLQNLSLNKILLFLFLPILFSCHKKINLVMRISSLIVILFLSFSSCRKTKLKGDKEILVGEWKWEHSVLIKTVSMGTSNTLITPMSTNKTYKIIFYKKGKVEFFEDGFSVAKVRLFIPNYQENWHYDTSKKGYNFNIHTGGSGKIELFGYLFDQGAVDTLRIKNGYPFKTEDCYESYVHSCGYSNYFIRVK